MSNPPRPDKRATGRHGGCPVCGRPPSADNTPFCSQGCRDRDLLQWLGEGYRLPGVATQTDTEE